MNSHPIPFGLLDLQDVRMTDRGYAPYPEVILYDPVLQVTNLITMGGKTEPTTMSQCADTTGVWPFSPSDSDESSDDTGTD